MAELVGAFGVPHMPNTPLAVRQSPTGELGQLFGAVRDQVDAVPFWVNGIAPPLPLAGRVYAAGQMVRQAIAALPVHPRVGIIASGALSGDIGGTHALPGGPGGPPDEEWVRFAIDWSLRRCGVLRTGGKTGGGFGRTTAHAAPAPAGSTADVNEASAQAHAQHEHGGGHGSHVILRAGRGGERWQQVCQADVPATQGAQTFEAFQETLAGAQRLQPTRGAQAIPRWYMTSFDWLGRLPSRAMRPAPNVHGGWHAPLDRLDVRLMVVGDDRARRLA